MNNSETIRAFLFVKASAQLKMCAEILDRLKEHHPVIDVSVITYDKALEYFNGKHPKVINLATPENPDFLQLVTHCYQFINNNMPQVVLAYDEYPAIAAANLADIPAILITNWLPPEQTLQANALAKASSVVLLEEPGIYAIPSLSPEVIFCGPVSCKATHYAEQRQLLRNKFGIEETAVVITATQGALLAGGRPVYATISSTIISAFLLLDFEPKYIIVNQESTSANERYSTNTVKNMRVISTPELIQEYMALSNLIITNGSRECLLEAKTIGIPTISLIHNPGTLDYILGSRVRTNLMLNAQAVTSNDLAFYIEQILKIENEPENIRNGYPEANGANRASDAIASEALRLTFKSYHER